MVMRRYRPEWITPGGAGVTTMHFSGGAIPSTLANAVRTFFNAIAGQFPDDVTIQFPAEVEEVDETTGELIGTTAVTPPASVAGTATGSFAAPAGARLRWNTGAIVRGRRVIGTTFLVPITGAAFGADGTLLGANRTSIQTAAATLIATPNVALAIWSRPSTTGGSDGTYHSVTGASVPEQVSVLRSRRD